MNKKHSMVVACLVLIIILFNSITTAAMSLNELKNIEVYDSAGNIITVELDPSARVWKTISNGIPVAYSGLVKNNAGVWYCKNGLVDFSYTGLFHVDEDDWLIVDGRVAFDYSGEYQQYGNTYKVKNGKVANHYSFKDIIIIIGKVVVILAVIAVIIIAAVKRYISNSKPYKKSLKVLENVQSQNPSNLTTYLTLDSSQQFKNFSIEKARKEIMNYCDEIEAAIQDNIVISRNAMEQVDQCLSESNGLYLSSLIISRISKIRDEINQICPTFYSLFYSYTSPQGRNHYESGWNFSKDDIAGIIQERNILRQRRSSAEYQRQLMTPKMRYEILQRDNFHCVLCGRGLEDGIKLHVDHVKPVSKGGKTVPDNLRTLCQDCNLGKSDSYSDSTYYRNPWA